MDEHVYTHAMWRVKPGLEEDFIEGWLALSETFIELSDPPLWGTLLRSATEPNVFYSFGPWRSAAHVETMRSNEEAVAAIGILRDLCEDSSPGMYHVVRHVRTPR